MTRLTGSAAVAYDGSGSRLLPSSIPPDAPSSRANPAKVRRAAAHP
jgi:hypothetical protein